MARRKHCNFHDDNFKAAAIALSEIPGVLATHVAETLDLQCLLFLNQIQLNTTVTFAAVACPVFISRESFTPADGV